MKYATVLVISVWLTAIAQGDQATMLLEKVGRNSVLLKEGIHEWFIEEYQAAMPEVAAQLRESMPDNPTNKTDELMKRASARFAEVYSAPRTNRTTMRLEVRDEHNWYGEWRYHNELAAITGAHPFMVTFHCVSNLLTQVDMRRRKVLISDEPLAVLAETFACEPAFYCSQKATEYVWEILSQDDRFVILSGKSSSNITVEVSIDKTDWQVKRLTRSYYSKAVEPEYSIERTADGYIERIVDIKGNLRQQRSCTKVSRPPSPAELHKSFSFIMTNGLFVEVNTKDIKLRNVPSDTLMR